MQTAVRKRLEFLSVLKQHNYRRYWIGLVTSVTSHQALITAQGWLVYDITGEELALGLVAAAQAIPAIAFNLFGGALADRYDPRKLIVMGSGSAFLVIFLLAVLVLTGLVEIWHIIISAFFIGIATSLDQPARRVVWPALIRFGTKLPSGVIRPGPTANTLPISGFSLPMSGTTMFPYICSPSSFGRIITLSPKGEIGHSIINLIV